MIGASEGPFLPSSLPPILLSLAVAYPRLPSPILLPEFGEWRLREESAVDPEEVERALCALRGVGPWTAHMYLVFHLRRPDVWPTGDYGVRQGFRAIFGLGELPSPRRLHEMGEPYRPHRTAVAWYCWRILDVRPPSEGPAPSR